MFFWVILLIMHILNFIIQIFTHFIKLFKYIFCKNELLLQIFILFNVVVIKYIHYLHK